MNQSFRIEFRNRGGAIEMNRVLSILFFSIGVFVGRPGFANAFDHQHTEWNSILHRSVTWTGASSAVNYKTLKSEPKPLGHYLQTLSAVKTSEFNVWSKAEQLAFLINAYNAFTVQLILDHYPVKSIKKIGGLFSSPWSLKFFSLLGDERNLDWIEHKKIRPEFAEPRIHFALVCASKGCPGLQAEAFVADRLNDQLQGAALKFLTDSSKNRYDADKKVLWLSSIFKWYKDDFIKAKGSIQAFVLPFMESANQPATQFDSATEIKFLDYNWDLNE
jgi:hypothetical protein